MLSILLLVLVLWSWTVATPTLTALGQRLRWKLLPLDISPIEDLYELTELEADGEAVMEAVSETPTGDVVSKPAMPAKVIAYAKSWGTDWAEADILERANRLYKELGNWELVYQTLLQDDGEKDNA